MLEKCCLKCHWTLKSLSVAVYKRKQAYSVTLRKSSLTRLMRVHVKSIWMNLGGGTEGKSSSTLQGISDQLGENMSKKRSMEATPAFSGSKFANINKGVITKLQLLQTKFSKTWNFSLSKMLIEQMHNNLVCPNTSKYLHHIYLRKVRSLWNFFWKYFHEQC